MLGAALVVYFSSRALRRNLAPWSLGARQLLPPFIVRFKSSALKILAQVENFETPLVLLS
jgi:hypothetical protein